MLGKAMQKAQDLHIKHLYATGEDQQNPATTSSTDILPEITEYGTETDTRMAITCRTSGRHPDNMATRK